jgi:carbon-monoxide dehydrogenase medium subunit
MRESTPRCASRKHGRVSYWEDVLIPGAFEYHRPANLSEAVALLGQLDSDARVIAGGHSLIPMMKLRLAMPSHLVDLAGVAELKGVRLEGGEIVIGAMTTQHEIIGSELLAQHAPILRETAEVIADPQVRYVGTIGGNVANGDPGNDMPALMMTLGATYVLRGASGERRVAAREYYLSPYETAAEPAEVLAAVRVPAPPVGHGWAYEKLKRKVGDYATAAAAVILTVSGGKIATCAIGLTNVAGTALMANDAAAAVIGTALDKPALAQAAAAATAIAKPAADGRGSAEYRAKMAGVMTGRALTRALARARS